MLTLGVDARLLYLKRSAAKAAPASAVKLESAGRTQPVRRISPGQFLILLARWFLIEPRRSLRVFSHVWRHPHRWIFLQALPVAAWCRTHRIQFVHAHFADQNFALAKAVSDWSGIPFGVTTHRYDLFDQPLATELQHEIYQRAHLIVTISEYNKRFMVEQLGLDASRIAIVHCGIDGDRFSFRPSACNWEDRPIRLLSVGRLVPAKAHDVLLQALAQLKNAGVDALLSVVGGGPDEETLRRQAKSLGVSENVTWHGAQPDSFVRSELRHADLFVLPSRAEGLPVALMEAMASGVPVVTTRIFGIPELVVHEEGGLLVPPDDADALAEALVWAARNPGAMGAMRVRAREAVMRGFNRTTCSGELLAHWQKVVGEMAA